MIKYLTYDYRVLCTVGSAAYLEGIPYSGFRNSVGIPKYKSLIARKLEATSDYSYEKYVISDVKLASSRFTAQFSFPPYNIIERSYNGLPFMNVGFLSPPIPDDNKALSRLYENVRKTRTEMNGLQTLGELRETLRLIRRPAAALRDACSRFAARNSRMRGKFPSSLSANNRKDFVDAVSGSWLELQFGIKPLISDVQSIAKTIARINVDLERRVTRVRGSSTVVTPNVIEFIARTQANPQATQFESAPRSAQFDQLRDRTSSAEVRYLLFLESRLSGPTTSIANIASISGATLENIVPTLYELTPYSFLIDYWSNLGDVINGAFTDRSGFLHCQRSTISKSVNAVSSNYDLSYFKQECIDQYYTLLNGNGDSGYYREAKIAFNRVRLASLPLPTLEFNVPNSGMKIANMLALLNAPLKGFRF